MRLFTATMLITAAAACDKINLACTEVGCNGSLELSFVRESWEEGSYVITADMGDGYVQTCTLDLSMTAELSCDYFDVVYDGATLTVPMATPMNDGLTDVTVTLTFADEVLVDEVIAPEWGEPYYPNGEECDAGYGCLSAEWVFTL
jgi:hypothetical protein